MARFENEHVRVWEMDLAPGQICGLDRHTLDYVLYILEGGRTDRSRVARDDLESLSRSNHL